MAPTNGFLTGDFISAGKVYIHMYKGPLSIYTQKYTYLSPVFLKYIFDRGEIGA